MKIFALAGRFLVVPLVLLAADAPAYASSAAVAPATPKVSAPAGQPTATGDDTWTALARSAWIVEGNPKARHVVYVFTDTECKYCRQLWQAMQPYLAGGKLQSRHVMVAVIAKDSAGRAAAVMAARHPSVALKSNENSTLPRLAPELAIARSTLKKLDDNAQLMHRLGVQGTPAIAYQDASGKTSVVQGIPPADVLAQIFGPVATR